MSDKHHRREALRSSPTGDAVTRDKAEDSRQKTRRKPRQLTKGAAVAIENAALLEETKRRAQELQGLCNIMIAATESLDVQKIAESVLLKTLEVLRLDAGRLYLFNEADQRLHLTAYHSLPSKSFEGFLSYAPGQGVVGKIFEQRQAIVFSDLENDPHYRRLSNSRKARELGFRSAAGVPIIAQGSVLGVIHVTGREIRQFTAQDLELLAAIGTQVGVAVEHAKLFRETQQNLQQMRVLQEINTAIISTLDLRTILEELVEKIGRLLPDFGAAVRLLNPKTGELGILTSSNIDKGAGEVDKAHGLSRAVFESRAPIVINDARTDPRVRDPEFVLREGMVSYLGLPLIAKGEVLGVLSFFSKGNTHFFSREEIEYLSALAGQAAVAIHNARLYEQRKTQAAELEKINAALERTEKIQRLLKELSQDITSMDAYASTEKLLGKVREFFQVDISDIRVIQDGGWRLIGVAGIERDRLGRALRPQPGRRSSWIFENRRPLSVRDITQSPEFEPGRHIVQIGVRGYLSVPLFSRRGEVIGLLRALSYQPREFTEEETDLLQQLANGAAIVIENARLLEETQQRAQEQATLNSIAAATSESLRLDELLKIALGKVSETTGREKAYIRLKDPGTDELELAAYRGISPAYVETLLHGRTASGKSAQVFESGRSLIINDTEGTLLKKETLQEGIRSIAWVPMKARGKVIGILNVSTSKPTPFSQSEVALLEAIGSVIGNAVENARLFEETESRAKEISVLYDVTATVSQSLDLDQVLHEVLGKVMGIFSFDAARIYVFNREAGELRLRAALDERQESRHYTRVFRPGQGNIGQAFKTGEPIVFGDAQHDPRYQGSTLTRTMERSGFSFFAAFPIKAKSGPIGVLSCIGQSPRKLKPQETGLLNSMANQIGIAIENAQLYEETKKQAIELKRSNKVKDEFLGVMSHELRTPLSAVMGYAAMLQDGGLGEIESKQASALRVIENQTKDLLDMINSILEATKIEAGAAVIQSQPTDLKPLLDEIKSTYDISLKKDVALIWDYDGDLPPIITDPAKLKHILQNLINNAIKFTHEGQIVLSARYLRYLHKVEFQVSDTGVGIPPEMQSAIFERFRQADSSDTRLYGGVGLGLYIAKSFTEMLGGALAVASEAGKGSVFTLALPVELRPAAEYFSGAAHA